MKDFARALRKNQTDAEKVLWRRLRNRELLGHKFRRQHPVGDFIVDFCCPEKRFIVELDGGQHSWKAEADNARTLYLESKGFTVMRFWNNQVLNELESVLERILLHLDSVD